MNRPYPIGLMSRIAGAVVLAVLAGTLAGCGSVPRQGAAIPDQLEAERAQLFRQGFTQYSN